MCLQDVKVKRPQGKPHVLGAGLLAHSAGAHRSNQSRDRHRLRDVRQSDGPSSSACDGLRYDNRDCGLSTHFDEYPVDIGQFIGAASAGDFATAAAMIPYSLRDLTGDGIGLLDALGVERAHVVGSSMGGMIAQTMAIEFPARMITLTSMMSSTGEPEHGRSSTEAQQVLFTAKPADRAGYIDASEREVAWASRRFADVEAIRKLAAETTTVPTIRQACPVNSAR